MVFNGWGPGLCIRSLYMFIPLYTPQYHTISKYILTNIVGSCCWSCVSPTHTFKLSHGGLSVSSEAMRTGLWSLQTATDLEKIVTFEGGLFHGLLSGLMDSHCRSFKAFFLHWLIRLIVLIFSILVSVCLTPVVGNVTFLLISEIPHWPRFPNGHGPTPNITNQALSCAPCWWPSIFILGDWRRNGLSFWGSRSLLRIDLSSVWQRFHQFLPSCKQIHNTAIVLSIWRWIKTYDS